MSTVTDVVQPGQTVTARIIGLDSGTNRISLTLKPADSPEREARRGPPRGERGPPREDYGGDSREGSGDRPGRGKVATRGARLDASIASIGGGRRASILITLHSDRGKGACSGLHGCYHPWQGRAGRAAGRVTRTGFARCSGECQVWCSSWTGHSKTLIISLRACADPQHAAGGGGEGGKQRQAAQPLNIKVGDEVTGKVQPCGCTAKTFRVLCWAPRAAAVVLLQVAKSASAVSWARCMWRVCSCACCRSVQDSHGSVGINALAPPQPAVPAVCMPCTVLPLTI